MYCYLATTLPVADDNWTLKYFPFFPPHTFSLWVYLIHTERRVLPFSSLIIELNSCWYWYHHKWLGDVTIRRAQPVQMKGKSSLVFDSVWDDETYVLPKCHLIGLSPIYSRDNSLMQCLHLLAEYFCWKLIIRHLDTRKKNILWSCTCAHYPVHLVGGGV